MSLFNIFCGICLAFSFSVNATAQDVDWSKTSLIAGDLYRTFEIQKLVIQGNFKGKVLDIEFRQDSGRTKLKLRYQDRTTTVAVLPRLIDLNSVKVERGAYQDVVIMKFRAGEHFPECENNINGLSQSYYSLSSDLEDVIVMSSLEFSQECKIQEGDVRLKLSWTD